MSRHIFSKLDSPVKLRGRFEIRPRRMNLIPDEYQEDTLIDRFILAGKFTEEGAKPEKAEPIEAKEEPKEEPKKSAPIKKKTSSKKKSSKNK